MKFCQRMGGWTYDDLQDAPGWWVARARVLFAAEDRFRAERLEEAEGW